MTLQIVQDEAADEVLSTNAFALLCGMLLQQQAPVDVAFAGPAKILDRFGTLDPRAISEATPEEFAEICAAEPAVHPYPESMSVLIQAVARYIVVNYGGDTASIWQTAGSGEHLLSRLTLMPGFSRRKSQMFIALLGRQLGVRPPGWERAAGLYAQRGGYRSVADIHDRESLEKVRNAKSARRKGEADAGDGPSADGKSAHHKESKVLMTMNTEEQPTETADDSADKADKRAARKAARRAARKAERRDGSLATEADRDADPSEVDAESGTESATDSDDQPAVQGGERLTAEERAERKAAKRAARRAAAGKDPQGRGRPGGRQGGGRNARQGRGGRIGPDSEAGEQTPDSSRDATSSDATTVETELAGPES